MKYYLLFGTDLESNRAAAEQIQKIKLLDVVCFTKKELILRLIFGPRDKVVFILIHLRILGFYFQLFCLFAEGVEVNILSVEGNTVNGVFRNYFYIKLLMFLHNRP